MTCPLIVTFWLSCKAPPCLAIKSSSGLVSPASRTETFVDADTPARAYCDGLLSSAATILSL